ncbi:MAG: GTP-binding protein [Pseudomonadota bacterium]
MSGEKGLKRARTPVHVLTGFLGSGKTTLLTTLLRQPSLRNTLVIVNELGEVGFDHLLLMETSEEVVVQLDGGCVCCAVRGDLVRTLAGAHEHIESAVAGGFERVIIETSGLAAPDAIIRTLMLEADVASNYVLGRIVATFDVLQGARTAASYPEARSQLAAAEIVVPTKLDLLETLDPAALAAEIRAYNPGAEVCSSAEFLVRAGRWIGDVAPCELPSVDCALQAGPIEATSVAHSQNIQTFQLRCSKPLERRRFNAWLALRLRFHEGQILRVKGLVQFIDSRCPVFVHGVQQMFHPARTFEAWPTAKPETHLVFITQDVSLDTVERSFTEHVMQQCSASPLPT